MKSKSELDADRRLIALVRKVPALYDGEDAQYQDGAWKNAAWRRISTEIGMDVKLCRSRWFNMRDIYRKSLIRNGMKRRLGQSVRVYKYARDLAFLDRFFHLPAEPDPLSNDSDDGAEEVGSASLSEPPVELSKAERASPLDFGEAEHSPFVEREPRADEAAPPHPVTAFLACIEPTLKALPPYLLSLAKGEIFAAVQKYELRMLGGEAAWDSAAGDKGQP